MIAEMEIELATIQSMVGRMGEIADDFLEEFRGQEIPIERAHELLKDHQNMKWVVNRNAIEIVNRAMDVVGGSGFMTRIHCHDYTAAYERAPLCSHTLLPKPGITSAR